MKQEKTPELIIHRDYLPILRPVIGEHGYAILKALVDRAEQGIETTFNDVLDASVYAAIEGRVARERDHILSVKEKRKACGKLGGEAKKEAVANATNCYQMVPFATNSETKKENESEKEEKKEKYQKKNKEEKDKDKEKEKEYKEKENFRKVFKPPTLEEVKAYFREKGFEAEAEAFYYFYESKNWMVGKNKMQSWHAAASGWLSRKTNQPTQTTQTLRTNGTVKSDRLESGLYDKEWKGVLYGYKSQVS